MNQRQSPRLIIRIQNPDHLDQFIGRHGVANLQADRIADAPEVFNMSPVDRSRAITDPGHMSPQVVPTSLSLHASQSLLKQQQ